MRPFNIKYGGAYGRLIFGSFINQVLKEALVSQVLKKEFEFCTKHTSLVTRGLSDDCEIVNITVHLLAFGF
jgi:hypothetical protein